MQKKKNKKPFWIIILEYLPAICIWYTINILPFKVKITIGKWLGFMMFLLLKNYREVVRCNLKIVFPYLKIQKQNILIKKSFINFALFIIESIALYSLSKKKFFKKCFLPPATIDILNQIRNKNQKNRGTIIYSAHFGSYYWNSYLMSLFLNEESLSANNLNPKNIFGRVKKKVHVIVRKLDNPLINRKMKKLFEKGNINMIERGLAFFKVSNILTKTTGVVFVMSDQNCSKGKLYVPFFKKNASTMSGPFHLYQKTKADSYFMYNYRQNNQIHFEIKPISKSHQTAFSLFKEINAYTEKIIQKHPQQYFWLHPRWKKQKTPRDYIYGKLKV